MSLGINKIRYSAKMTRRAPCGMIINPVITLCIHNTRKPCSRFLVEIIRRICTDQKAVLPFIDDIVCHNHSISEDRWHIASALNIKIDLVITDALRGGIAIHHEYNDAMRIGQCIVVNRSIKLIGNVGRYKFARSIHFNDSDGIFIKGR